MTSTALMVIIIAGDFCEATKGEMISFKKTNLLSVPLVPQPFPVLQNIVELHKLLEVGRHLVNLGRINFSFGKLGGNLFGKPQIRRTKQRLYDHDHNPLLTIIDLTCIKPL